MKKFIKICTITVLVPAFLCAPVTGQISISTTDMTPTEPLPNPSPSNYQPRYISGFGSGDSFTLFFEDRNVDSMISYVSTTTGTTGLSASAISTNIFDTHFCVKDWPININGIDYAYRAWGALWNTPDHHFYVSNDLEEWTLVSTFTIPTLEGVLGGIVYYGHHHGRVVERACRNNYLSDLIKRFTRHCHGVVGSVVQPRPRLNPPPDHICADVGI